MPIVIAPLTKVVRVVRVLADEKLKKHLESLGITVNSELTVLSSERGSVICKVKEGRLALDKGVATKILVV